MAKIKTAELTGIALNWAVAKIEGHVKDLLIINNKRSGSIELWWRADVHTCNPLRDDRGEPKYLFGGVPVGLFGNPADVEYSTDWALGGPIIDRLEELQLWKWGGEPRDEMMCADMPDRSVPEVTRYKAWFGKTKLQAAMRCYVASKLGDEVDIPEELL